MKPVYVPPPPTRLERALFRFELTVLVIVIVSTAAIVVINVWGH